MTAEPDTTPAPGRPGGRSARVRAAVHRAVEEMVTEGVEDLTVPAVAARAGVHPTTVYRRWGSVAELLAAVAGQRFRGDVLVPDTGSLRGDLERWATDVARDLTDPEVQALVRATLGASGGAGASACVTDRYAQVEAIAERERARGGTPPAADDVVDTLIGPLYYRALFSPGPDDAERPRRLVARLLSSPAGSG